MKGATVDELELNKEHYFFEIKRKYEISRSLSIPIALVSAFFTAWYSLIINFEYSPWEWYVNLFMIFAILAFAFLSISIYYIARSYVGYKYIFIPTTLDLQSYSKKIMDYSRQEGVSPIIAKREFKAFLIKAYTEATHENTNQNDSKSEYWHWGVIFVILAMLPLGMCTIVSLLQFFRVV